MFGFKIGSNNSKTEQIKEALASGALIIDVRTPGEFDAGHIEGAMNIPLDQIDFMVNKLKKRGQPIIGYCQTGRRSGLVVDRLSRSGLEAYNAGGMDELLAILN